MNKRNIYTIIMRCLNNKTQVQAYPSYKRDYIYKPLVSFTNAKEAEIYLQQICKNIMPKFDIQYYIERSAIDVTDLKNKILLHDFYEQSYASTKSKLSSRTENIENLPQIMVDFPKSAIGHLVVNFKELE